jgi:gliding motility-associated protein GldM
MAGGKETPRQKMIGMMYLVLTALLALNVSKEILDAFVTINSGLETTKVTFDRKLNQQYAAFEASYNENSAKYGPAWTKAQKLRTEANELVSHIDKIKAKTIADTEGLTMEEVLGQERAGVDTVLNLRFVKNKDNYDVNTLIMIGPEPARPRDDAHQDGYNYRAAVLKQKMEAYRESLKEMINADPHLSRAVDSLFTFPERIRDASGTFQNWESLNFYHVPLAATTTILSKLQSDVRNTESDVLNYLFADVDRASFKFTKLVPIVLPEKTYVLQGDSFRAKVFLGAYDDTNMPDIFIGAEGVKVDTKTNELPGDKGRKVKIGSDGLGKLSLPANAIGDKNWEGVIKFRNPTGGGYTPYPYKITYEVAKPALVVSPIKMNVLYRGIENPVAISVPGISQDDLRATISVGTLVKQSDGTYIAKDIKTGTKATVSVSAEIDGKVKPMGTFEFRVKSVPDPVAKFAGKGPSDATAQASELTAALGVVADLPDFEFDLKYPVKSFDLTVIMGGNVKTISSNNNKLTDEQRELLKQVRRNQTVIIENIRATAPDGSIRKLGSINLRVI